MSFAAPLFLIALVAIPLLAVWYAGQQRRRERGTAAFVMPALLPSVAPNRPRWRRHAPMLVFALALVALIVAAARPQRTVAVPLTDGAVMLVNDVSSSMGATDLYPTRVGAAARAGQQFIATVPGTIRVGVMEFSTTPTLLQSPTTDHALTSAALTQLKALGHTAIGDAINAAAGILERLRTSSGKRVPSAIVLLSDGVSTQGADPIVAARAAKAQHIPIYTVSVGTAHGTINVPKHGKLVPAPVPPSPQELGQIAAVSGGEAFKVGDTVRLKSVYTHLAAELGHTNVKHQMTASLAGGGLLLLLFGSALSLRWFGRLV
jgi:Ca-activated chloride channel family protein